MSFIWCSMIDGIAGLDLELLHAKCLDWDKSPVPQAVAAMGELQPSYTSLRFASVQN